MRGIEVAGIVQIQTVAHIGRQFGSRSQTIGICIKEWTVVSVLLLYMTVMKRIYAIFQNFEDCKSHSYRFIDGYFRPRRLHHDQILINEFTETFETAFIILVWSAISCTFTRLRSCSQVLPNVSLALSFVKDLVVGAQMFRRMHTVFSSAFSRSDTNCSREVEKKLIGIQKS